MSVVQIQASPKQLSKLRNGHKVRIRPAMEGKGFASLIIDPSKYSVIDRAFTRGKGVEIALSPAEIQANMDAHSSMGGKGIFGKAFDRFVEKTIGKKAKNALYKGADMLKAPIKAGIDKLGEYAPELGASALSAAALALGQPELVPVAAALGRKVGSMVGKKGTDVAKDYLDRPTYYQDKLSGRRSNVGGTRSAPTPPVLARQLNEALGTNMGFREQATLGSLGARTAGAEVVDDGLSGERARLRAVGGQGLYVSPPHLQRGMGLGMGVRSRRCGGAIGVGGTILGQQNPALQSQPFSANFQFQHTLPPSYQKFSRGTGLNL